MSLKKTTSLLVAAVLCITLAACSKDTKTDTKATDTKATDTAATPAATTAATDAPAVTVAPPAKPTKLTVLLDGAMMLGGYDNPADRLKQWEDDLASGKIKENT